MSMPTSYRRIATWLVALAATFALGATAAAAGMQPIIAWRPQRPQSATLGQTIPLDDTRFTGSGTLPAWRPMRMLASAIRPDYAAQCRPFWTRMPDGHDALALAAYRTAAPGAAILRCGEPGKLGKPLALTRFTLFIAFRQVADLFAGGGSPQWELDGSLIDLPPGISLYLSGRGRNGRRRHLPHLRVGTGGHTLDAAAEMTGEIEQNRWYRLAVTYAPVAKPGVAPTVRMWLDGTAVPVKLSGAGLRTVSLPPVISPVRIAGNGRWGNCPLELGGFAVYDIPLPAQRAAALRVARVPVTPGQSVETTPRPAYQRLDNLNHANAWRPSSAHVALQDVASPPMLRLALDGLAVKDSVTVYLRRPVALDRSVTSVNVWACDPAYGGLGFGFVLDPVFADGKGREVMPRRGRSFEWGNTFLNTHIAPQNTRKCGLWRYLFCDIPRREGAVRLVGLRLTVTYVQGGGKVRGTRRFYLKDLGLERIDYRRTPLYYVVGNYRDNFAMTGFNGDGARAMTAESSGSGVPEVLLDNLVDQAKGGRPHRLDLHVSAYDSEDRPVYSHWFRGLAAKDVPDFFHPLPIPLTHPGTYRLEGRSYADDTHVYFTTDWVKLIVLKGKAPSRYPRVEDTDWLRIDPKLPFGRLEPDAPRRIHFDVHVPPGVSGPLQLRYAVIPYSVWIPGGRAKRPVQLTQRLRVTHSGVLTVPYERRRSVELVVAELWAGDRCLDHAERPIGVRNTLDHTPPFTAKARIPDLETLATGPVNWMNIQFHEVPMDQLTDFFASHIEEARKLTHNLGFRPVLSRVEPIPGVYDWDWFDPAFGIAAGHQCRIIPYLAEKWPFTWAPVEFWQRADGCVHRSSVMWGYMIGRYLYCNGEHGPALLRQFNTQLARHVLNEPGFGGYYFENEHIDTRWIPPLPESHDPGNRRRFTGYLAHRYGDIAKLNHAYGTDYRSFADVVPPDAGDPAHFPRRVMFVDWRLYQRHMVEHFVLHDQVEAVRRVDPKRPIIIYNLGEESAHFLRTVVADGAMMANGGVHSTTYTDARYERYNAIPGLRYRMEPHSMWNYNPSPAVGGRYAHAQCGFDEMIFGMLAMGGRGLNFHIFLPNRGGWTYAKATRPGQTTGLDKLVAAEPVCRELRNAEKRHDPIGILSLRSPAEYFGGPYTEGIRAVHSAVYAHAHWNPKTLFPTGDLHYLQGCRLVFLGGAIIDNAEIAWLRHFLVNGGFLVMEAKDARYSLERPDADVPNALLAGLGIDYFAPGTPLAGVPWPHDCYRVGKGKLLFLRRRLNCGQWLRIVPVLTAWAGLHRRLADSDDPYMQIHVLQDGDTWYLVTTHRADDRGWPIGPLTWSGTVRFLAPLPAASYRVTEIWSGGGNLGIMTPARLAAGIPTGPYINWQMKIFRIAPAKTR